MLGHTGYTPYDVNFSVFGIQVRVHPLFWIMGALLGQGNLGLGLDFLLGWMLVFFVSILVHELGHALTAVYFGYRPVIFLYGMGGLAAYAPTGRYNRGQSMAITFAGPAAGFCLAAAAMALRIALTPTISQLPERPAQLLSSILAYLFVVNLYWSVLNLFPVIPLDGGQLCRDILTYFDRHRGLIWTHWIGVIVGGGLAALMLSGGNLWGGIIFLMLAYQNYQAIQFSRWR